MQGERAAGEAQAALFVTGRSTVAQGPSGAKPPEAIRKYICGNYYINI